MPSPAEKIIEKFGGAGELARALGVAPSTVYRWVYPRNRRGTGGIIPPENHLKILDLARERGIEISPEDFFCQTWLDHIRAFGLDRTERVLLAVSLLAGLSGAGTLLYWLAVYLLGW